MASFYLNVTASGQTTADVYGQFTGGESSYSYSRRAKIDVYSGGSLYNTYYITSDESSGGTSTFDWGIGSLQASTTYTYVATLQYWSGSWTDSSYTDSGSFTTYSPPVTHYVTLHFDPNGGTPSVYSDVTGSYTDPDTSVELTMPSAPTKTGYTFAGWSGYAAGRDYPFTEGTYTLVADWVVLPRSGRVVIKTSTGWHSHKAYIYTSNGWLSADAYVFNGTNWEKCNG